MLKKQLFKEEVMLFKTSHLAKKNSSRFKKQKAHTWDSVKLVRKVCLRVSAVEENRTNMFCDLIHI